jgi:hypothetical protein
VVERVVEGEGEEVGDSDTVGVVEGEVDGVMDGVRLEVGVNDTVGVELGVSDGMREFDGVMLDVGDGVRVLVGVGVRVGVAAGAHTSVNQAGSVTEEGLESVHEGMGKQAHVVSSHATLGP